MAKRATNKDEEKKEKVTKKSTTSAKSKSSSAKKTTPKKSSAKKSTASKTATKTASKTATRKTTTSSKKPAKAKTKKSSQKTNAISPSKEAKTIRKEIEALDLDTRELPHEYGVTKITLMTRDPETLFAYWEINSETRKKHQLRRGRHNKPLILRVFEKIEGQSNPVHYDIEVNDYTSSWYLKKRSSATLVQVALGLYDKSGAFLELCLSNEISIPRLGFSKEEDAEFAEINDEVYHQIVKLSGVQKQSSSEERDAISAAQRRIVETLYEGPFSSGGLYSSGSIFGLSSGVLGGSSSSGMTSTYMAQPAAGGEDTLKKPAHHDDSFWLEVGVDVVVYGATQPDAHVTIMGQKVNLTQDGTFRIRMVLPDSTLEFPIEAVSSDGKEKRKVKPVVKRKTEGDPHKSS